MQSLSSALRNGYRRSAKRNESPPSRAAHRSVERPMGERHTGGCEAGSSFTEGLSVVSFGIVDAESELTRCARTRPPSELAMDAASVGYPQS